ncbi:MAG: NAD(P)/FAD-dependent oxidoreductase [Dehalococcoidia bacterium]|nr:NAD(P)/FAD-dependent oxidoreductase [Dehalococcoidia bacterium]
MTSEGKIRDVVIVGGGPAGSTLARELAAKGVDVLLLEKSKLPRNKTCAGGVTARAAALLPFDYSSVVEDTIYRARVSYRLERHLVRDTNRPLTYTVSRDRFDHLLCQEAIRQGAEVRDGEKVTTVIQREGFVELSATSGEFSGRVVVGADGPMSVVASSLRMKRHVRVHWGLQAEVRADHIQLAPWAGSVGLDFGRIPTGYTWLFPKWGHVSIGAGSPPHLARNLKRYVREHVAAMGFSEIDVISMKGHCMPVRLGKGRIVEGRVLLLGDAAGLMDPFTGEGIYAAMRSASLALPAVIRGLNFGPDILVEYQRSVDKELMPEAALAMGLSRLCALAPRMIYDRFDRDIRVWNAFCRLLRGETTYSYLVSRMGLMKYVLKLSAL